MSNNSMPRRVFMMQAAVAAASLVAAGQALSQTPASTPTSLDEANPQAIALGYKVDSAKVDAVKYPKHAAAQKCLNCSLFQGKATDATGPCAIFVGKTVSAKGWCSAYVKKPA